MGCEKAESIEIKRERRERREKREREGKEVGISIKISALPILTPDTKRFGA